MTRLERGVRDAPIETTGHLSYRDEYTTNAAPVSYPTPMGSGHHRKGTMVMKILKPITIAAVAMLLAAGFTSCSEETTATPSVGTSVKAMIADPPAIGAVESGTYRNLFEEWLGYDEAAVDAKIDRLWTHYFLGGRLEKLYYDDGSNENGPLVYRGI
jgi:hypothetical protein